MCRTLIRDGVRKVPFMRDLQDDDLGAFELDEVNSGYVFCKEGKVRRLGGEASL